MTGASNSVVEFVTLSKTTGGFSGGGQAAHFTVLMDRLANPINFWVGPDPLVEGINHDNFVKLVSGVFGDPVRVQDSQATTFTANTLLKNSNVTYLYKMVKLCTESDASL